MLRSRDAAALGALAAGRWLWAPRRGGLRALFRRRGRTSRPAALGLGLAMVVYGNTFAAVDHLTHLPLGGTVGGVLLGLGAVGMAARDGRARLDELGLQRRGLRRSLLGGGLLGLALGLPGLVYFLRPDLMPVPVRYEAVRALGPSTLVTLLFGKTAVATALAEELAFRGLLQSRLRAAFGPPRAVLIGALVFTAWHLVVSLTTLLATNLGARPLLAALAYVVQILSVLLAGVAFGLLRERSGNLAGCVLAHWLVDVLLVAGLYLAK